MGQEIVIVNGMSQNRPTAFACPGAAPRHRVVVRAPRPMGFKRSHLQLSSQAAGHKVAQLCQRGAPAILKYRIDLAICIQGGLPDLIHIDQRRGKGFFTNDMLACR